MTPTKLLLGQIAIVFAIVFGGVWARRCGRRRCYDKDDTDAQAIPRWSTASRFGMFIQVPELDEALRSYSSAHAASHGSARPVADPIPAMLASFIEGERAITGWKRSQA